MFQRSFTMVDFLKTSASIEPIYASNSFIPFEWKGMQFFPHFKKGFLKGFESEYKGLRVYLRYDKITLSNSLHKFYKGNNYSDFTYSELSNAVNEICQKFEIDADQWKIIKMEFGFNVSTPKPAEEYIDLFMSYKEREFEKMKQKQKQKYYGRKCFFTEYDLKVYDKHLQTQIDDHFDIPNNILRVEFCYNQKRKLPKQIKTLFDLLDREKFKELYSDFKEAFSKVIYNDKVDFNHSTSVERLLFYASLNSNFIKVEEQINKVEAKAMKVKIKKLKERFFKKEFKQWFLQALSSKYIELYCS